jgi:hypothetical protein
LSLESEGGRYAKLTLKNYINVIYVYYPYSLFFLSLELKSTLSGRWIAYRQKVLVTWGFSMTCIWHNLSRTISLGMMKYASCQSVMCLRAHKEILFFKERDSSSYTTCLHLSSFVVFSVIQGNMKLPKRMWH